MVHYSLASWVGSLPNVLPLPTDGATYPWRIWGAQDKTIDVLFCPVSHLATTATATPTATATGCWLTSTL